MALGSRQLRGRSDTVGHLTRHRGRLVQQWSDVRNATDGWSEAAHVELANKVSRHIDSIVSRWCTLGMSLCGITVPLTVLDRTSDVTSPCYVHLRRRPSVWGVGGALTRHVSHVCSTGIQRDPCCGPLERVRMLLSVEKWQISQLVVERDII